MKKKSSGKSLDEKQRSRGPRKSTNASTREGSRQRSGNNLPARRSL